MAEQEKEKIERTKKLSIKEGSAYAMSEGLGMRYITPYALALGANNAHIGFLSSLPSLLASFSQLFTPKVMEKIPRKKIAFYGALLQALMWIPVLALGVVFFVFNISAPIPILLILVYTLLVLFGSFYGPAWNSWMKDLVKEKSGKYFGSRNRIVGFVALVSMLIGGFILNYFKKRIFFGFLILFGAAFVARSISAILLLKKYEPKLKLEKEYYFTFWQFLKRAPQNNFGRFVLFVALMQLATAIASPFFTVYMLKELGFSYVQWIAVVISSSLCSLLFMPVWGKFADAYGNIKVIKICSFLIPFIPLMWLVSPSFNSFKFLFLYLVMVEAFSGLAWAGFNLSSSNFVFDAVTRQRMALCVAYFNILLNVGVFIGASFGGILSSFKFIVFGFTPLLFLFFLSGMFRLFIALIMIKKIKEVRDVPKFDIKEAKKQLSTLTAGKLLRILEINIKPRLAQT